MEKTINSFMKFRKVVQNVEGTLRSVGRGMLALGIEGGAGMLFDTANELEQGLFNLQDSLSADIMVLPRDERERLLKSLKVYERSILGV